MSNQAWVEPFITAGEDGTALASSITATSILHASRKFTLPSYFFDATGKTLRVRATGRISTVVTTPGTLTLEVRFGSVAVFTSGAMTLNIVAQTNTHWMLDVDLVCRTMGASTSANLLSQGTWKSHAVIGSPAPTAGGAGEHMLPYNAAPAVGTGFDSTAAQTVDLFATWSVSNAANSIQCHSFSILALN
ncbi:MAG: hypothetical protein M3Y08_01315 [Fibrobacterota bacterium]|nr:hypothetical protein [Fibrobacterota bacterium]